jgi:hypothetical protein
MSKLETNWGLAALFLGATRMPAVGPDRAQSQSRVLRLWALNFAAGYLSSR